MIFKEQMVISTFEELGYSVLYRSIGGFACMVFRNGDNYCSIDLKDVRNAPLDWLVDTVTIRFELLKERG